MRILAIDTGSNVCSVMLYKKGRVIGTATRETERDQAKILAPLTQELMGQHNWPLASITRLAIAVGPGSFTGLRVGLAFARGLALALTRPLYGFDHFQIMHHALTGIGCSNALLVRDSKRAELFTAYIRNGVLDADYQLKTAAGLVSELQKTPHTTLVGDGAAHIIAEMPELEKRQLKLPQEVFMQSLCARVENTDEERAAPEPLYLREADVSFPSSKKPRSKTSFA